MYKYIILFLLGFSQIVYGQDASKDKSTEDPYKKAAIVKPVRAFMKAGNFSAVVDETNKAFKKYAEAADDAELHNYQVKALEQLVLAENKKMYLANKPDTTKYFGYMYQMYRQALICDSLEQIPTLAGKPVFRFRYANALTLLKYRSNLKVSCKYYFRKKDYKNAFAFSDLYYKSKSAQIFTGKKNEQLLPEEKDNVEISVMAVLSAFGSQNNNGVITYLHEAMNDKQTRYKVLELGCKSYLALGDTAEYVKHCTTGFNEKPEQEYFFMALLKYYIDNANHSKCLELANIMVSKFPKNRNYWFIKAKEEEILEKGDDAIASYQKAIELKKDDAEAYSYIGSIYTNKAQDMYNKNTLSVSNPGYRQFKNNIKAVYVKAKEAYEAAREYAPKNHSLWYEGLKNSYFKLNMGKELKQLEELNRK